jgi:hypothetical protein
MTFMVSVEPRFSISAEYSHPRSSVAQAATVLNVSFLSAVNHVFQHQLFAKHE